MATLFTDKWMEQFGKAWNSDKEMVANLASIGFDSNIGYGLIGEPHPRGVLIVQAGQVTFAGAYTTQALNWDLRANLEDWKTWIEKGFVLARLGITVATGKLKFVVGDYRRMLRTPSMAGPFLHSFELMSKVKTDFKVT